MPTKWDHECDDDTGDDRKDDRDDRDGDTENDAIALGIADTMAKKADVLRFRGAQAIA